MHKGLELLKNAVYKVFKKAAKIPFTILVILTGTVIYYNKKKSVK